MNDLCDSWQKYWTLYSIDKSWNPSLSRYVRSWHPRRWSGYQSVSTTSYYPVHVLCTQFIWLQHFSAIIRILLKTFTTKSSLITYLTHVLIPQFAGSCRWPNSNWIALNKFWWGANPGITARLNSDMPSFQNLQTNWPHSIFKQMPWVRVSKGYQLGNQKRICKLKKHFDEVSRVSFHLWLYPFEIRGNVS